MQLEQLERALLNVLGSTYGGPSLSYNHERRYFELYEWGDAPVGTRVIAEGATLSELVEDLRKKGLL